MSGSPYLIGIAGPSGAGKSYLASHLAARLSAPVLALDHYYRDLSHLPLEERAQSNFDEPAALEHDLLIAQITDLREGKRIDVPIYDFSIHTRTRETQLFHPSEFVIIEGLFTLHWPELRHHLGTGVYVDMTDEICLQRRRDRDVRERGRTPESVIEQFQKSVAPMAERYIRPTRAHADVVVFGAIPIAEEVERVLEHVRRSVTGSFADLHETGPQCGQDSHRNHSLAEKV
jgi:uridine kinase